MSLITTAGLARELASTKSSKRKDALKSIREKLRSTSATDDDWDEALDALVEVARNIDDD